MRAPQIDILGVYRLPVTEELFREQYEILYGEPDLRAEQQCRQQLTSVVLIELLVKERDEGFYVGQFTQPQEGVPEANWQVPWAEVYLTPDGEALAVPRWGEPPQTRDLRIAFFFHYWQPEIALSCSYGDFQCPAVQEMPERLRRLVPYEPVD
jgi:hypothetical protein